jgi:hypothetical protein
MLIQELKEKGNQLTTLLKEVKILIDKLNVEQVDPSSQKQLKGISRMISSFERRGVPVPEELRNLKATLVNKVGEYEEINKIINEIYLNVNETLPVKTNNKERRKKRISTINPDRKISSVKLINLIESGYIEPNTRIFRKHRNGIYEGIILENGQVSILLNGVKKIFDSLSTAAVAYKNRPINGWYFWSILKNNKEVKLRFIREEFYNKNAL